MRRSAGCVDAIHRDLNVVAIGRVDYEFVLRRPGLKCDFASFSFQVPMCGLAARHTVALTNNTAKASRIALPFILPPH